MSGRKRQGLNILSASFFHAPVLDVAESLIDTYLLSNREGILCGGRIVETEAYLGKNDPASHAACGPTNRNKYMFGLGGFVYVYMIYGMHYCFNVTAGGNKEPGAILIRALEPEFGIEKMKQRRSISDSRRLTSGPANLVRALAINLEDNGKKLPAKDIFFAASKEPQRKVLRSSRVGISKATNLKYRFYASGSAFISPSRV